MIHLHSATSPALSQQQVESEKKETASIQKDADQTFVLSKKELHFTVEDIDNLAKCNLGLRHVSTPEEAEKEAEKGVNYGCSLNISPKIGQLRGKKEERNWSKIPVAERDEIAQCFEKAIDVFIKNSLVHDIWEGKAPMIDFGKTKMSAVAQLVTTTRFSIIDYLELFKYCVTDFSAWGKGLGRYTKYSIPAKQITRLPPVKLEDLGYTDKELDDMIKDDDHKDELFRRMIVCYRNTIIQTIRPHFQAKTNFQFSN